VLSPVAGCDGEDGDGRDREEDALATRYEPSLDIAYDITYASCMTTITASRARSQLYRLLDQTAESHEPITITGKRHDAVLISEEDWRAIEETLYLLSIPGMRESIRKGMRTPLSKTSKRPGW
jgi:prevent-host-death family protein